MSFFIAARIRRIRVVEVLETELIPPLPEDKVAYPTGVVGLYSVSDISGKWWGLTNVTLHYTLK
jgi:hypothetical protein